VSTIKGPEYLGAIGVGDKTTITQVASTRLCWNRDGYHGADFGLFSPAYQRPSYIQVASYGYIVRPVARAIKTKHAGLNLVTWATSYKPQARAQA